MVDLTVRNRGTLKISISPHGASLAGSVQNDEGGTMANLLVTLRRIASTARQGPVPLLNRRTDWDGRFEFQGLAPGEYQVLAWEEVDLNLAMNPEFYSQFTGKFTVVQIEEGAQKNVSVKFVPRDAIAPAEAKLPY